MRRDHRPYAAKRAYLALERAWQRHFLSPQLEAMGPHCTVMRPWHLEVHGPRITFGSCVHVVTAPDRKVRLTTWQHDAGGGSIAIGDYALLCPGVRLDSASEIIVGRNSMLAAGVYLTDADWHDVYDRTRPIGATAPVVLEDNVWVGDGSIVCKGVRVGANSVIGAGSVVTRDVPANVIAAGNPARTVRALDDTVPLVRRDSLFAHPEDLAARMDGLDRYLLSGNTWWGWLRTWLKPTRND